MYRKPYILTHILRSELQHNSLTAVIRSGSDPTPARAVSLLCGPCLSSTPLDACRGKGHCDRRVQQLDVGTEGPRVRIRTLNGSCDKLQVTTIGPDKNQVEAVKELLMQILPKDILTLQSTSSGNWTCPDNVFLYRTYVVC